MKKTEIRAVAMVRRIRDKQAHLLAGKSEEQIIAFFREAGERARHEVRAMRARIKAGKRGGSTAPSRRSRRPRTRLVRGGRSPGR